MQFDTLIFDLDGTLSDPKPGVVNSMNYALTSFGYPPRKESEIAKHIGPPLEKTISLLTDNTDEKHIDELIAKYRERYFEIGYKENSLYPEIHAMLEILKAKKHRMGICTSKHKTIAERIVQRFKIDIFFEFVDGPTRKASKKSQLKKLLEAKIITKQSMMIGDRAVDLVAARSNSLASAGVLWGYGNQIELSKEKPKFLFKTPIELAQNFIEG